MDAVSSGHADTSIYVKEENKKHILDNDLPQLNNEKGGGGESFPSRWK